MHKASLPSYLDDLADCPGANLALLRGSTLQGAAWDGFGLVWMHPVERLVRSSLGALLSSHARSPAVTASPMLLEPVHVSGMLCEGLAGPWLPSAPRSCSSSSGCLAGWSSSLQLLVGFPSLSMCFFSLPGCTSSQQCVGLFLAC